MDGDKLAALLVAQAPDAVIFAGTDGVIQVWNAAAERIFGHTAEEAIGQDLNLIIPDRFQEQHWKGYDRALADRATKYVGKALATRSQRKDGAQIYVELSFEIVKDAAGEAIGALAHARDITERFEQDRAARRRTTQLQQVIEQAGLVVPAAEA